MTSQSTEQDKFTPPILSIPKQEDQPKPPMTLETIIQERRELAKPVKKDDVFTDVTILGIIAVVAFIFLIIKGH